MHTISITNQKGGVGKTTLTVNLAAELARLGKRVLVVDMDTQCDATYTLCGDAERTGDIYKVLTGEASASGSITEVGEKLWVLPGSLEMRFFDDEDEGVLRRALSGVSEDFDICVIDNPPALDNKTVNSLAASGYVLVVTEPGTYAQRGICALLESVRNVSRTCNW